MSDLDRLVRFVVVAEELSFSRAAERLGVDQPWLSRQVQQLETNIGFRLFTRNTRQVALTDEGAALLEDARRLAEAATATRAAIKRVERDYSGGIALGVSASSFWLPGRVMLLERFAQAYKRTHVHVMSEGSARLVRDVRSGVLDCAIMLGTTRDTELERVALNRAPISLLVPVELVVSERPAFTAAELAGLPLAVTPGALRRGAADPIYGPLLAGGVAPVVVPEGRPAMHFYARQQRLAMVAIGWPHSDEDVGADFAHRSIAVDIEPLEFGLIRRRDNSRRVVDQFWRTALAVSRELCPPADA